MINFQLENFKTYREKKIDPKLITIRKQKIIIEY